MISVVSDPGSAPLDGAEVPDRPRGRYSIFLGMAAGVGKTYRMLQEGHAEAENGRDVVIGYLEPHDRQETIALSEGLEMIPRRRVTYRDSTLEEIDLQSRSRVRFATSPGCRPALGWPHR